MSRDDELGGYLRHAGVAWTVVHTHENHGFGGPVFIRKEWRLSG